MFLAVTLLAGIRVTAVDEVKIGVVGPMQDIQGESSWNGAQLAAMEINALGGIDVGGTMHTITLVQVDSAQGQATPTYDTGVDAGDELIAAGVDYVIGGFRTEAVNGFWSVLKANSKLYINCGAATDALLGELQTSDPAVYNANKYIFRVTPINSTMLVATLMTCMKMYFIPEILLPTFGVETSPGVKQVLFTTIMDNLEWTIPMRTLLTNPAYYPGYIGDYANYTGPAGGILVDPYATDLSAQVSTIASLGARLVVQIFSASAGVTFVKEMAKQEVPAVLIGIDVPSQMIEMWTLTEGACEYESFLATFGTRTAISTMMTDFWDHYVGNYTDEPIYTGAGTYNAVYMLKQALETAGTKDTDAVITTLEGIQMQVATGTLKFTSSPLGSGKGHDVYMTVMELTPYWPPPQYVRALITQWQVHDSTPSRECVAPAFYGPGVPIPWAKAYQLPLWMSPLFQDINHDGKVDIDDVVRAALAFGSYAGPPPHERWDRVADVTGDGKVDIDDVVMVALAFGKWVEPWPITFPPGPTIYPVP